MAVWWSSDKLAVASGGRVVMVVTWRIKKMSQLVDARKGLTYFLSIKVYLHMHFISNINGH